MSDDDGGNIINLFDDDSVIFEADGDSTGYLWEIKEIDGTIHEVYGKIVMAEVLLIIVIDEQPVLMLPYHAISHILRVFDDDLTEEMEDNLGI